MKRKGKRLELKPLSFLHQKHDQEVESLQRNTIPISPLRFQENSMKQWVLDTGKLRNENWDSETAFNVHRENLTFT